MIVWLFPLALVTAGAALAPVVVHLLLRNRARVVVLPTVRFVPRVAPSAVRVRRPADPWLLLVRVGIIASAALAFGRPLLLTGARHERWGERVARAVVVERGGGGQGAVADSTVEAERRGADPVAVMESTDLAAALARASRWLAQSPPARREIVVLSAFRHGTLHPVDLASVPSGIGLRFVRLAGEGTEREGLRETLLAEAGTRDRTASVAGWRTDVQFLQPVLREHDGLQWQLGRDGATERARLLRVAAAGGARAPSAAHPLRIRFRDGGPLPGEAQPADAATLDAALRLVQVRRLAEVPMAVSVSGTEMRIDADVEASSFAAASLVSAALNVRGEDALRLAAERERIPDSVLRGWSRDTRAPGVEEWRRSDESDGRWFWAACLALLALEGVVRRRRALGDQGVARAA